jgi:hypothetical protein
MYPGRGSIPRQTDWLTVSRNVTQTQTQTQITSHSRDNVIAESQLRLEEAGSWNVDSSGIQRKEERLPLEASTKQRLVKTWWWTLVLYVCNSELQSVVTSSFSEVSSAFDYQSKPRL